MCFEGGWTCVYGDTWAWNHQVVPSDIQHPANALLIGEWPVNYNVINTANNYPWAAYSSGNPSYAPYCDNYALGGGIGSIGWDQRVAGDQLLLGVPVPGAVGPPLGSGRALKWLRSDCNQNVATFHNQNMNCLHVDGHVSQVSQSTLFNYACQYYIPSKPAHDNRVVEAGCPVVVPLTRAPIRLPADCSSLTANKVGGPCRGTATNSQTMAIRRLSQRLSP